MIHLMGYVATASWPEARAIVEGMFGALDRPIAAQDVQRRAATAAPAARR
jgi:hypothetical protein